VGLKNKQTISKDKKKHVVHRAQQRFHLNFSRGTRRRFKSAIKNGKATLIQRVNKERLLYNVPYRGESYKIIYNPKTNYIVTILPNKSSKDYDDLRNIENQPKKTLKYNSQV
jgi:hypothetical protein